MFACMFHLCDCIASLLHVVTLLFAVISTPIALLVSVFAITITNAIIVVVVVIIYSCCIAVSLLVGLLPPTLNRSLVYTAFGVQ